MLENGPDCGSSQQEARLEVLPAENGAPSHGSIPPIGGGASTRPRPANISLRTARSGRASRRLIVYHAAVYNIWTTVVGETRKHPVPVRARDRTKIAELFVDERCSKAILEFLATTNVGKAAGSSASAWENRERKNARSTSHRWRRTRQGWVGGTLGG